MIFDMGGRHLAPTTGLKRIGRSVEARTSEYWENGHLARSRARTEELGNPKRIPARYATA